MSLLAPEIKVDPFQGRQGYKPAEKEDAIEIQLDEAVNRILKKYENILELETPISDLEFDVLTPAQIAQFCLATKIRQHPDRLSRFLNRLIVESYLAGNNHFIIISKDNMEYFGHNLEGSITDPLYITVNGNLDNSSFVNAKYCQIILYGNPKGWFGEASQYCKYKIEGNVTGGLGFKSKHSTYLIKGEVIARNLGAFSENCVYQTTNPLTYRRMIELVHKPNTVQLIDRIEHVIE